MNLHHLSIFFAHKLTKAITIEQYINMQSGIKIVFCSCTHEPDFSSAGVQEMSDLDMPLIDSYEIIIDTRSSKKAIDSIPIKSSPNRELTENLIIKELFTQIYRQVLAIQWQPAQILAFNKYMATLSNEIAFIEKELLSDLLNNVYH